LAFLGVNYIGWSFEFLTRMGLLNDLRPVEGVGATVLTEPLEFLITRLLLRGFLKETGHNPEAF